MTLPFGDSMPSTMTALVSGTKSIVSMVGTNVKGFLVGVLENEIVGEGVGAFDGEEVGEGSSSKDRM